MNGTNNFGALVGRFLLALIFLLSGFHKLMNPSSTIQLMGAHGIPLVWLAYVATIIIEFGFAFLVMIGYMTRPVAIVMLLWFIPVTLIFHVAAYRDALAHAQAQIATMQQVNYMKNLSIMGGLLLLASFGAGAFSVDGRKAGNGASDARHAA